jgi:NTE family protein
MDGDVSLRRVGLALSGGSVRGIAHIGVMKAVTEAGIQPEFVVGTSVGSIIGAGIAAGMGWRELKGMADSVFWPSLLAGRKLEQFCRRHLPASFADLKLPFAAIATIVPGKRTVVLKQGKLAPAISASCAMRLIRRAVPLDGERMKDGGMSCVLPSLECRSLGAEFVMGSDVWEIGAFLRGCGLDCDHPRARHVYPARYREAVKGSDVLVQPDIPVKVYVPGCLSIDQLIDAGERATRRALALVGKEGTPGVERISLDALTG